VRLVSNPYKLTLAIEQSHLETVLAALAIDDAQLGQRIDRTTDDGRTEPGDVADFCPGDINRLM